MKIYVFIRQLNPDIFKQITDYDENYWIEITYAGKMYTTKNIGFRNQIEQHFFLNYNENNPCFYIALMQQNSIIQIGKHCLFEMKVNLYFGQVKLFKNDLVYFDMGDYIYKEKKTLQNMEMSHYELKESLNSLSINNQSLNKTNRTLQQDNTSLSSSFTKLREQNRMLQISYSNIETKHSSIQSENEQLKEDVEKLICTKLKMENEIIELRKRNEDLDQQNEILFKKIDKLEYKIENLN